MEKYPKQKKIFLTTSVIISLGALIVFKYSDFMIANFNGVFGTKIALLNLALPIGISFYTFQVLSYIIDIYNGKVAAQRSLIKLATYVSLFPQLIAGPIVRYTDVEKELTKREHTFEKFSLGIRRFIVGLSKKVLIANSLGELCQIFLATDEKSIVFYWIYGIAFSLQIYFDFSAYSDMAIGLGKMLGFEFLENFNYPYISKSITEFWRRWHISLSQWFRDYVYIPLGGNRVGKVKLIRNIFVVWMLTGLWHGASWNFILWGVYYGIILIIEKVFLGRIIEKLPKVLQHIYALFFIIIGWVIFRVEDFSQMGMVLQKMFTWQASGIVDNIILNFDIFSSLPYVLMGIIGSVPLFARIRERKRDTIFYQIVSNIWIFGIFILSICFLLVATYNPFIYFRF